MKTFKKIALLFVAAVASLGFTSCKQLYYQVYDVKSESMTQQDNSLVYENSDVKLMYNLWGEKGAVGFIIQNKTDKDLFIDLTQTFFILNGKANDYYQNREYTSTTTTTNSLSVGFTQSYWSRNGYWPTRYYVPVTESVLAKVMKGQSNGVTTKEKAIVCVPAHAWKVIDEYKVTPDVQQTCDRKVDFPTHKATVGSYSESNSPLKFKNRISYAFDRDCNNLKQIENEFYVSGVTNYSKKEAVKKVKEKVDCYDMMAQKREYFKIGGPDKFFVTYLKK